jgi:lipopolysaccharide/colanic/teichoic acid biosynthesis glycosyltransferase
MDELPQLINILKGDMSFVGPRPERPYFVEKFSREILGYARRFSVRPGLTGLAQVYARHDTLPQEKLRFDLAYIQRSNPLLDLKLIFLSFLITFKAGWERFEREKVS